jgi:hypothetical protein
MSEWSPSCIFKVCWMYGCMDVCMYRGGVCETKIKSRFLIEFFVSSSQVWKESVETSSFLNTQEVEEE